MTTPRTTTLRTTQKRTKDKAEEAARSGDIDFLDISIIRSCAHPLGATIDELLTELMYPEKKIRASLRRLTKKEYIQQDIATQAYMLTDTIPQLDNDPTWIDRAISAATMYYVYALTDPRTQQIYYIGKTHDIRQRMLQHFVTELGNNKIQNSDKQYITLDIFASGLQPQVSVLYTTQDKDDVANKEQELIGQMGKQLTNRTHNPFAQKTYSHSFADCHSYATPEGTVALCAQRDPELFMGASKEFAATINDRRKHNLYASIALSPTNSGSMG